MEQNRINNNQVITFKEGIPGFEQLTKFILLEEEDGVFYYLRSIEDNNIVFPILDPYIIKQDYNPNINESYFEKLGGGDTREFILFSIATIKEDVGESTLNLQAPLLIHVHRRIGVQAIVENNIYKTRHKIADLIKERGAREC